MKPLNFIKKMSENYMGKYNVNDSGDILDKGQGYHH